MANYTIDDHISAVLFCSDQKRSTEILSNLPIVDSDLITSRLSEDGVIHIESIRGLPRKEILNLSEKYPDVTFTTRYGFEDVGCSTLHTLEFTNGSVRECDLEPMYLFHANDEYNRYKEIMGDHFEHLLDKAVELFSRLDIVTVDEEGDSSIAFNEATISVEDEEYKMTLTKDLYSIEEIKCFKKARPGVMIPV